MNRLSRAAGLLWSGLLFGCPERACADDFWLRAAERDHGASRRVVAAAERVQGGRGDDADAHRVRLALIDDPRAPELSERALVSVSLVALELGIEPGPERRARVERIAFAPEVMPWASAAARLLGAVEWRQGHVPEACRYWHRALALSFEPGERAELSVRLGFAFRARREPTAAARHFSRALGLADDASVARRDVEAALAGLAILALDAGDEAVARRLGARSAAVQSARSNVSGASLVTAYALGPEAQAALERVTALGRVEPDAEPEAAGADGDGADRDASGGAAKRKSAQ